MSRRARSDQAFGLYASLGPARSLTRLNEVIRGNPTAHGFMRAPALRTLESWSAADDWAGRAAVLDREAQESEERELVEHIREHRGRLRQEGLLLQQRGVQWLTAKDANDVRASDAIRAIGEGFRLEALGLGEPTERLSIEERLRTPLEELSDDELARMVDRLRRAAAGGADGAVAAEP